MLIIQYVALPKKYDDAEYRKGKHVIESLSFVDFLHDLIGLGVICHCGWVEGLFANK